MLKPCLNCKQKKHANAFSKKKPLYCLLCEPGRKSRAALCSLKVDFDKEQRRLLTILHRDIEKLMDSSHERILGKDESSALISYLKLVNELRAMKLLEEAQTEIKEN